MTEPTPPATPPPTTPPPTTPAGDPPATAKITLPGGVTVELPKSDAEKILAARTKENAERDELARRAGAAEAERKAAEDKATRESTEKEAIRLAKDGEVAKAREMLTAESNAKLALISKRLADQAVEAALRRACPGLDDAAVADMKSLIAPGAAYDAESGRVTFQGPDGKPIPGADGQPLGPDGFLAGWLDKRPHFKVAQAPPRPNDGTPGGTPPPAGTIRVGDLKTADAATVALVTSGRLRVVD